jgi:hypothetical protein
MSSSWNMTASKPNRLNTGSFCDHAKVGRTLGPNGSAPSEMFHGPNENLYACGAAIASLLRSLVANQCPRVGRGLQAWRRGARNGALRARGYAASRDN